MVINKILWETIEDCHHKNKYLSSIFAEKSLVWWHDSLGWNSSSYHNGNLLSKKGKL